MHRNGVAAVRRASSASGAYLKVPQPTVHNMPEMKTAGTGGRHSNSGITATVFGSYGFVGKYVMNYLGGCGSRAYVPFRGDEMDVREVRQCFDNGQVGLMPFSPRDHDSIRESIRRSDVVINLIGKHYDTKHAVPTRRENGTLSRVNYGIEEVNVTIPQTLARLAREAGVSTFIHVSALSASETSASHFSRTKAIGEKAVRQEFPEAIIVRPANIFGPEDRFLNWFAVAAQYLRFYPLLYGGETLVQPVYADDVAKALMEIVWNRHDFAGANFNLAGPDVFSYKEVVEFVADVTHIKRPMVEIPEQLATVVGKVSEQFMNPYFTADAMKMMAEDNILVLDEAEQASRPIRKIVPQWSLEDRMDRFNLLKAAGDTRAVVNPTSEFLSPAEATSRIVAENKNHVFTFGDLGIETESMDRTAFDYLKRFRLGGKFQLVQGYKK